MRLKHVPAKGAQLLIIYYVSRPLKKVILVEFHHNVNYPTFKGILITKKLKD